MDMMAFYWSLTRSVTRLPNFCLTNLFYRFPHQPINSLRKYFIATYLIFAKKSWQPFQETIFRNFLLNVVWLKINSFHEKFYDFFYEGNLQVVTVWFSASLTRPYPARLPWILTNKRCLRFFKYNRLIEFVLVEINYFKKWFLSNTSAAFKRG